MTELHQKYAPILRFTRGESFFPTRVEDMLSYSTLYLKGQDSPLVRRGEVTPDHLTRYRQSPEIFLRSVDSGPLFGADVIGDWSQETVELVYRWAQESVVNWTEELARRAYSWFSPKTKSAAELFWWNRLLPPLLKGLLESGPADELPRFILPMETRDAAAERYQAWLRKASNYTYYYRQVRDGNYLCLQYWFFYSYNDWARSFKGLNDHEGDWEGMLIFFRRDGQGRLQEPPAYLTYVGHHSRMTKPWEHAEVERVGTHPVGYVAAGSHATYPQAKTYPLLALYNLVDQASGDDVTIDHDQWVYRIALDQVSWLTDYRGSWGTRYWLNTERARTFLTLALATTPFSFLATRTTPREIELPGVSAPHGPMIGDTGQERPQWANPAAWAEVPVG